MKTDLKNTLQTLLIVLNESDLLETKSCENLFSCFPAIEKEGVLNLIVYVDILKSASIDQKNQLKQILKNKIINVSKKFSFNDSNLIVIENYDEIKLLSSSFSVYFVLGLGGRDELKNILSDFVQEKNNKKDENKEKRKSDAEMQNETEIYISNHLKLPFEPDLIFSCSDHFLTDFMIWQTVYSEYYFTVKSAKHLKPSDFSNAFESYHKRERRYGA